ncbi:MAG TPA: immunoglobulin-like domain-containing protein [Pyrinomonadaceae bacterium]|nr:immunoglobulin-like domain-containing protein [Pyrinomonadaceae bacterium]
MLLALGALAILPGSSAATRRRADAAPASPEVASKTASLREAARIAPVATSPATLVPAPFFQTPPIATYAADCTTPKSSFNLGDTVCVKLSGVSSIGTAVVFTDPDNITRSEPVPVSPTGSAYTFILPTDPTTDGADNRGTWAAAVVNTVDNSRRNVTNFSVHDPDEQVADVTISKTALDTEQALAGNNISYRIYVTNQGPDSATDVSFVDNTLPNTTFVSFADDGASGFNCTSPAVGSAGQTTCTKATMAVGDVASFTAVYHVNGSAGTGADLTDTIEVDSDTADSHDSSNSSTVNGTAVNPNPPACTISCPANVSQDSDPGQPGAVVNYTAPATSGTCGTVVTDHPSGSFFPIGTTVVHADAGNGAACTFSVTVIDKRTVAVTVIGAADITVECRNGFTDAGATATDGTNVLPVTTTVTVPDPSGATDSNGDAIQVPAPGNVVNPNKPNNYLITYTASDGNGNTGKATRTVRVVDTAPPVITIAGIENFTPQTEVVTVVNDDGTTSTVNVTILVGTVECHDGFSAPTATAFDGCDNVSVPVTTSGSVDMGTPGVYDLIYRATDVAGNDAERRLRVNVVDTTGPEISLNGASPMTVECHTSFTDPGASAADACEGPVPVSASGSVDPNTVGTYVITYTASDSGGRTTTKTRTVNVVDTTAPVVTLNGSASVTVECHTGYTDAGASATDSCSPTTSLSSTSDVNVNAPGTYHVVWSATDPSGNVGTATRTVVVVDTIPPTLTLNGYAPSLWPANHSYRTFNVTDFVTGASDSCDTTLGVGDVVIEKVTSDETENGNGDGNTLNDIVIAANCRSVQLRAERQGGGNGRVYTITFMVSDGTNVTRKTAKVVVPHNPGSTPVDSGVGYTVNGNNCP